MQDVVKVACVQAEPVAFDRAATIDKLEGLVAEVAREGARLALFPETFIPVYPSNRWVRYLAGWGGKEAGAGRDAFARLAQQSVSIPGPDSDRLAGIARTNDLWLAVGANEIERGTIYNALLVYSPAGELALHHRKLMPTMQERLFHGLGECRRAPVTTAAAGTGPHRPLSPGCDPESLSSRWRASRKRRPMVSHPA